MGSTEKILGFSSMKGLFVHQFVALGFAMPQQEPIEPRQLQPRGTCANLPGFVGSLNRIVGGQDAPSPIPWQVSVRTGQDGGRHYCGGTILDSRTILCAAHCFPDKQIYNTYIMAGNVNRYKGENIAVSDIRFYDAAPWNSNTMDNDIVILKLAKPLNLGGSIQAACLPSPGFVPSDGSQCMDSGNGGNNNGPIGSCSNPDYKGDGNCDDGNNNAGCDFDGGDCCKDTQHKYCSECACKEGGCSAPDYRGDGHCDDGNN